MFKNKQPVKNTPREQKGRSMVEMIGVLGVVGVLSVIGFFGYTTAMNKHRANVLISEMSDISQIIALDIMKGNVHNIELREPYSKGQMENSPFRLAYGCRGGTNAQAPCLNATSFFVEIKDVPYWVCYEASPLLRHLAQTEIMYVNEIENGTCLKDQDNTFLSIFNFEGYIAGGTGIITEEADKNKSCTKAEDCGSASSGIKSPCVNGQCVPCSNDSQCWSPFKCNKVTGACENPTNKCSNDDQCKLSHPNMPYCSDGGACVECSTEKHCSDDKICRTESASCFSNVPKSGKCMSDNKKSFKVNGTHYVYFNNSGSWWDARRWCSNAGRRLVSLKDLGCAGNNSEYCVDANGKIPQQLLDLREETGNITTCVTDRKTACLAYTINILTGQIFTTQRSTGCNALCR